MELLNTHSAIHGLKTGECIATYEMIAGMAEICRDTAYKHLNIGALTW